MRRQASHECHAAQLVRESEAEFAKHKIYQDRPDVVLAEVSRLIGYLRGGHAPLFGSTATE